ncbi:MAG: hypothetical protein V2I25_00815 [Woeseiaceae bacterium]|jgi:hypothetical protein|nr:hypothetical protein [Woeseiaceae bacterium]
MDRHPLTRRRFLVSVIALSGAAGVSLRPDLFAASRAWAESNAALDPSLHAAMIRMARLLYPHDALPDDLYADIIDQALSDVATSAEFATQLEAAAAALDTQAGGHWPERDEATQTQAMRAIEAEPSFAAIQNRVKAGIYMSPAFWKHVGYEGPSKNFGGYLRRGAGDIDWLPEDA